MALCRFLEVAAVHKDKDQIYQDTISLLDIIEVSGVNGIQFGVIRKRILDLANDIKRLEVEDGKFND